MQVKDASARNEAAHENIICLRVYLPLCVYVYMIKHLNIVRRCSKLLESLDMYIIGIYLPHNFILFEVVQPRIQCGLKHMVLLCLNKVANV